MCQCLPVPEKSNQARQLLYPGRSEKLKFEFHGKGKIIKSSISDAQDLNQTGPAFQATQSRNTQLGIPVELLENCEE